MPNMPATMSTWIRFATAILRSARIRSGMSGFRAVIWRTMNRRSSATDTAPKASVRPASHPLSRPA